jgi:hypothetical protein
MWGIMEITAGNDGMLVNSARNSFQFDNNEQEQHIRKFSETRLRGTQKRDR